MNYKTRVRKLYAWSLLLALSPFLFVKTFHHHMLEQGYGPSDEHSDYYLSRPSHVCPICDFALFPYVVIEQAPLTVNVTDRGEAPLIPVRVIYNRPHYSYILRAPPVA